jgi:hypothetical protein
MYDPRDGCTPSAQDFRGSAVLVDRSLPFADSVCTFTTKVQNALSQGAQAVVIANTYGYQYPPTMLVEKALGHIPICMISKTDGLLLRTQQTVDFSFYKSYNSTHEPKPPSVYTGLNVLSPASLRWRWPAGQTTFNPQYFPSTTGELVLPIWREECLHKMGVAYTADSIKRQCNECYQYGSPLLNSANDVEQKILLFHFFLPQGIVLSNTCSEQVNLELTPSMLPPPLTNSLSMPRSLQ